MNNIYVVTIDQNDKRNTMHAIVKKQNSIKQTELGRQLDVLPVMRV